MTELSITSQEILPINLQTEIEATFDEYWALASTSKEAYREGEKLEEARLKALEREFGFARKVTAATEEMSRRHDGQVVLLFDVDETIARNEYNFDEENTYTTYVRPAFEPTVNALKNSLGDRLEIGLLTSRGESHLDEQLESPTFLAGVMEIVNPEFILSSRTESKVFKQIVQGSDGELYEDWDYGLKSLEYGETGTKQAEYCDEILKPDILQELKENGYSKTNPMWWNMKLGVLQKLVKTHPERAFVFVEDLWCADSIREDHSQVMGVRVYDEGFYSI